MNSAPPTPRSSSIGVSRPAPSGIRPTATLAAIFILLWLFGPTIAFLAVPFGGAPPEQTGEDFFSDPASLADYFFGKDVAFTILVVVTVITVARWWRVVQFEPTAMRPRWCRILPWVTVAAFAVTWVVSMSLTPDLSPSLTILQVIAMIGIVVLEELAWRGVVVAGLRGSGFPEWSVWLISSAGFAAMHLMNLFQGADLGGTLYQVAFTFLLGTACYLARRAAGLWLAVALHLLNNLAQTVGAPSGDSPPLGIALFLGFGYGAQILVILALPATIVFLVLEVRRTRRVAREAEAQTQAAVPAA